MESHVSLWHNFSLLVSYTARSRRQYCFHRLTPSLRCCAFLREPPYCYISSGHVEYAVCGCGSISLRFPFLVLFPMVMQLFHRSELSKDLKQSQGNTTLVLSLECHRCCNKFKPSFITLWSNTSKVRRRSRSGLPAARFIYLYFTPATSPRRSIPVSCVLHSHFQYAARHVRHFSPHNGVSSDYVQQTPFITKRIYVSRIVIYITSSLSRSSS